jgi:predicted MFS family arabinose efflux permease
MASSDRGGHELPERPPTEPHGAVTVEYLGIGGLLTQRTWQRWTLSSFLARLPISMALLGLVLAGHAETGSLAAGARLAGVTTFCAGLAGPLRGRLLDRRELRGGLQRNCFLTSGLFAAAAACVALQVQIIFLYGLCACLGYSFSGIWGGFRALLIVAVKPDRLRRAHFVESLMVEASWGAGPLIATILAVLGGAVAVLLGIAAISLLAGVSLIGVVRSNPRPRPRTHILRHRLDIRVLVSLAFCEGLGFGTFESNVPQRMPQYGLSPNLGGLFLLLLATGSVIGGTYVSLRPIKRTRTAWKASILFASFAVLMLPSILATSPVAYGGCLLFASLMLVPINGLGTSELEARIGARQRAEAFSCYQAATMIGSGLGTVLNGVLIGPIGARNIPYLSVALFLMLAAGLAIAARHSTSHAEYTTLAAEVPLRSSMLQHDPARANENMLIHRPKRPSADSHLRLTIRAFRSKFSVVR